MVTFESTDEGPAVRIVTAKNLHDLVRGRRADLGLTQSAVAAKADVSRKWLSDFERGRLPGAELALVLRLIWALGLELDGHPVSPGQANNGNVDLDALLATYHMR